MYVLAATATDEMSNTTEQTLDDESRQSYRNHNNQHREDQKAQERETLARAWMSAFLEANAVNVSQVELWIESNFGSLPTELQSVPRSELIIDSSPSKITLDFPPSPRQEKEPSQPDLLAARFQRTDQWIPVHSWLESLDTDKVVKSKDISDW